MANLLSIAEQAWSQLFHGQTTKKRWIEDLWLLQNGVRLPVWAKLRQDKREFGEEIFQVTC